jgi:hypothetical protein
MHSAGSHRVKRKRDADSVFDRVELKEEHRIVKANLEKKAPPGWLFGGKQEKVHCRTHPAIMRINGTSRIHFLAAAM